MPGIVVFKSLGDALRLGYRVIGKDANGYQVRVETAAGWAIALVDCRPV